MSGTVDPPQFAFKPPAPLAAPATAAAPATQAVQPQIQSAYHPPAMRAKKMAAKRGKK